MEVSTKSQEEIMEIARQILKKRNALVKTTESVEDVEN